MLEKIKTEMMSYGTERKAPDIAKRKYLMMQSRNKVAISHMNARNHPHLCKANIRVHIKICTVSSKDRIFVNLHQRETEFDRAYQDTHSQPYQLLYNESLECNWVKFKLSYAVKKFQKLDTIPVCPLFKGEQRIKSSTTLRLLEHAIKERVSCAFSLMYSQPATLPRAPLFPTSGTLIVSPHLLRERERELR